MVDLPLWIWIVVWGIAAWVAYVFYRMLDAAFSGAKPVEDRMDARVRQFPVVAVHEASGRTTYANNFLDAKRIIEESARRPGAFDMARMAETFDQHVAATEKNFLKTKRIIEAEARRPGNLAFAHPGCYEPGYEPEVMADAIQPNDIEFAYPQLYGMESVTRAMLRQTPKRLPLDPKPILPKNPTEDDIVARDPEIREMVREIQAVGEEIDAVRDARERRRARRGWFGWLRKNEPAEIAYGMSNTREM